MSIIDLLLETDIEKLKVDNKEYEIKRLSKALGQKFVITCKPLNNEQINHIVETSKSDVDAKLIAIVEACRLEGKRFSDKQLMDKFNVMTPKDLINKLLLPGEVSELHSVISKLSGYGKDVVTEIKN